MIDINSKDFVSDFDPTKATVGVIGYGYVGRAVESFFHWQSMSESKDPKQLFNVKVYDKADSSMGTLSDIVKDAQIIFVCVPTPMRKDGSCYTGIVESVLQDIVNEADAQNRSLSDFIAVIKSTVYPGFTDKMKAKYFIRLIFSPEFLTEKNSVQDFEDSNRILLGGSEADGLVAFKFFEARLYEKLLMNQCVIMHCSAKEAEMVKLFTNGILMTKVLFCNEIYQLCQKMDIDYEATRLLTCLDRRIGSSHTFVPGPDKFHDLGAGGHCLIKDVNNLRYLAHNFETGERVISAILERNDMLRVNRDWEDMKDRAVTDK